MAEFEKGVGQEIKLIEVSKSLFNLFNFLLTIKDGINILQLIVKRIITREL